MIGSLNGDTTIYAGKNYEQVGSTVSSINGETNISASHVDIKAAENKNVDKYKQSFEQKGLTVALNVPVINAAQSVAQGIKQQGKSGNNRVNALNAANTLLDTNKLIGSATGTYNAAKGLMQNGVNAKNLTQAAQGSGISVSITYGQQKNQSESEMITTQAAASQVKGTNTAVIARNGAMNIIGSDVYGLDSTYLQAAKDVNIQAFRETEIERSSNKSFGWNAGVAIAFDNGVSAGITGGANYGKGHGNGDGVSWRNSHIGAGTGATQIVSGETVNIKGGQVAGKGVAVKAKGLNIESLQDTYTYDGKQENMSAQVTVGWGGAAVGGSYDKSKSKVDYAVVNVQSGIFAGDDGYQIDLGDGVIHSKGGAIVSTADKDKNIINAADYQFENIENRSNAKASSVGFAGATSFRYADLDVLATRKEDSIFGGLFGKKGDPIGDKNSGVSRKQAAELLKYRQDNPNATYNQAAQNRNTSRIRFGLNTNDVHSTDKYAVGKLLLANVLGNTKDSESINHTTYAVVSDGNFNISSNNGKNNLAQSVANSGLPEYQTLEKIDRKAMLKDVELGKKVQKKFINENVVPVLDTAYKDKFILPHPKMKFVTDKNGNPVPDEDRIAEIKKEAIRKNLDPEKYLAELRDTYGVNIYKLAEVTDEERKQLNKVTYIDPLDGQEKSAVFDVYNGINNGIQEAAKYAVQNYITDGNIKNKGKIYENVYFTVSPNSGSSMSELVVAFYQKHLEGNFGLGKTNSTIQAEDMMRTYGSTGLYLGAHSRGTLTVANALKSFDIEENRKNSALSKTTIKMVGPAADVGEANRVYKLLQGNNETAQDIRIENNANDFVGSARFVGNNPATNDTNNSNKGLYKTVLDVFGWKGLLTGHGDVKASSHSCYGLGNLGCVQEGYRTPADTNDKTAIGKMGLEQTYTQVMGNEKGGEK
ncbi:MAG: hemagglutinin repeat-containing protein [Neisseriaceae bacterium]|nr:hemagglutinin repeat-containing protein [Neisseriaceae bacterium]